MSEEVNCSNETCEKKVYQNAKLFKNLGLYLNVGLQDNAELIAFFLYL